MNTFITQFKHLDFLAYYRVKSLNFIIIELINAIGHNQWNQENCHIIMLMALNDNFKNKQSSHMRSHGEFLG